MERIVNRLVTFGCSHTYGMGLKDCYNRITKFAGDEPSMYAWPQLLANKLHLECVNCSRPGNSCKGIWNDIVSENLTSADIVIVMWTHASRWCIIRDDEIEDIAFYMDSPTSNTYYKTYYDKQDANIDLNLRMSHVSMYLNSKDIKNYHAVYKDTDFQRIEFNTANIIDTVPSLNNLKLKYPKGSDNKHPGEQAHAEFADNLFEKLKEHV
jgi:hypothetical protein